MNAYVIAFCKLRLPIYFKFDDTITFVVFKLQLFEWGSSDLLLVAVIYFQHEI